VIVTPGTYRPVSTMLVSHESITITGEPNKPFPVIQSIAHDGLELKGNETLEHLEFDSADPNPDNPVQAALIADPDVTVSHVIINASGIGAIACAVSNDIDNSVCEASGNAGEAIFVGTPDDRASFTPTLTHVTAEAPGDAGLGLLAETTTGSNLEVDVVDSIIHGDHQDIVDANQSNESTTMEIDVRDSDYATDEELVGLGAATITGHGSDIKTKPVFVNAAKGDFREKANSHTIDAGTDTRFKKDLAGLPRLLGNAEDMGAYEFAAKPKVLKVKVVSTSKHGGVVVVTVAPEEFATDVKVVAVHRHDRIDSKQANLSDSSGADSVKFTLTGLARNTQYDVHAVASSRIGTTISGSENLHTK
jgi:hypothetical protein